MGEGWIFMRMACHPNLFSLQLWTFVKSWVVRELPMARFQIGGSVQKRNDDEGRTNSWHPWNRRIWRIGIGPNSINLRSVPKSRSDGSKSEWMGRRSPPNFGRSELTKFDDFTEFTKKSKKSKKGRKNVFPGIDKKTSKFDLFLELTLEVGLLRPKLWVVFPTRLFMRNCPKKGPKKTCKKVDVDWFAELVFEKEEGRGYLDVRRGPKFDELDRKVEKRHEQTLFLANLGPARQIWCSQGQKNTSETAKKGVQKQAETPFLSSFWGGLIGPRPPHQTRYTFCRILYR